MQAKQISLNLNHPGIAEIRIAKTLVKNQLLIARLLLSFTYNKALAYYFLIDAISKEAAEEFVMNFVFEKFAMQHLECKDYDLAISDCYNGDFIWTT